MLNYFPCTAVAQRIPRTDVVRFRPLEWANARMRALAAETLDQGWWRLLWMPPSLPYHFLGGPYECVESTAITKHLIFSSWVAAPSAIASLLSYEVQRRSSRKRIRSKTLPRPGLQSRIASTTEWRMSGPPRCPRSHCSAATGTCPPDRSIGCGTRPSGLAECGTLAAVGTRACRVPGWIRRHRRLHRERGLVLVSAGQRGTGEAHLRPLF